MDRIIGPQWDLFIADIYGGEEPEMQRREMRRAFFAGVAAMLNVNHLVGDKRVTEEEGERIFEKVDAELLEYLQDLKDGKA